MGACAIDCLLQSQINRDRTVAVPGLVVDASVDATWIPRLLLEQIGVQPVKQQTFQIAGGPGVIRDIGYVIIRAKGRETLDEVVFGEQGDRALLGARTLKGLSLALDPTSQELTEVDSISMPSASSSMREKATSPESNFRQGMRSEAVSGSSGDAIDGNQPVLQAIYAGEKIQAIKLLRDTMPGLGLAEAKAMVENKARELGVTAGTFGVKPGSGCVVVLVAVIIVGLCALFGVRLVTRI